MKNIILDIEHINDIKELHKYLKNLFEFPHYYGANLDALFECLTDIAEPTIVVLPADENMYEKFGSYGNLIHKVFLESSFENKNLIIKYESNMNL